jgi:hypothetical protein
MTPEELRAIMAYLKDRVKLAHKDTENPVVIIFLSPTAEEMVAAGLNAEGVGRILNAPWWEEMVTDIIETPDYCEPDDSAEQVLEYAQDVVSDYIRKRVSLSDE